MLTETMMETVQKQKQNKNKAKELGSGGSTNVNCGDNDINSASEIDAQVCGTLDVSVPRRYGLHSKISNNTLI